VHINRFDWDTDFPLHLRESSAKKKKSSITLEFNLTDAERALFRERIGSQINGTLPLALDFDKEGFEIRIAKQGRGQKTLNAKVQKIAAFIAEKVEIQYIPAVRTAEYAQAIVDELVSQQLGKLEDNPRYKQALSDIADLQKPLLESLSDQISETMREFLPNIREFSIHIGEQDRSFALRGIADILLNDGATTPLVFKGDGVQSLAAIALMRHTSEGAHQDRDVLIALEEPESHLHPNAIRQLRNVLSELSTRHQVVLTTHNAIFTNRKNISQNIIVQKNRAYPASSVKEIRDILGIRLDDNLSSAELILIVEGDEDRVALQSILSDMSKEVGKCFESGRLAIDVMRGAGNLGHRIRLHSDALCQVHAFLDDDRAGQQAFSAAQRHHLIDVGSVNFSKVAGKREAELEDLYEEELYQGIVRSLAGAEISKRGPDEKRKWTDRLRGVLARAGKLTDDNTILSIKLQVAQAASKKGSAALQANKRGPIDSLCSHLEQKLA
jgi:hypothetical protein